MCYLTNLRLKGREAVSLIVFRKLKEKYHKSKFAQIAQR